MVELAEAHTNCFVYNHHYTKDQMKTPVGCLCGISHLPAWCHSVN